MDVTHFPFDFQVCNLTFGSWAYSGRQVDVINVSDKADLTSYVQNTEWHVHKAPVMRLVTFYGDDPYPTLVLQLLLEVKFMYFKQYLSNILLLYAIKDKQKLISKTFICTAHQMTNHKCAHKFVFKN